MQVAFFILGLMLFIGLVVVHELGHLLVGRRNGVHSEEFGIGFPPRAWARTLKSGLVLSLNWLPLGGFVRLKGEYDDSREPGSFGAATLGAKCRILLAGVTANLVAGVILLMILAWVGMPVIVDKASNGVDQFSIKRDARTVRQEVLAGAVLPGSPASTIPLSSTDSILRLHSGRQNIAVKTPADLKRATSLLAGQQVELTYRHHGQVLSRSVQLLSRQVVVASQKTNQPKGYLGVEPNSLTIQRYSWSAPIVAVGDTTQFIWLSLQAFGHALGGLGSWLAGSLSANHAASANGASQAEGQVGGPVAVTEILWHLGDLGLSYTLMIIALISITLAIINVLPIPALDGGRLAMILLARKIWRRPLSRQLEGRLIGVGYLLIFGLVILITIVDVKRSF